MTKLMTVMTAMTVFALPAEAFQVCINVPNKARTFLTQDGLTPKQTVKRIVRKRFSQYKMNRKSAEIQAAKQALEKQLVIDMQAENAKIEAERSSAEQGW